MNRHPLARDLDHVLEHTAEVWRELRGARVFITGGTGFVGTWLLESLVWANQHSDAALKAVLLTRSPAAFRRKAPAVARDGSVALLQGDIGSFQFPEGAFEVAIHAATHAFAPAREVNALSAYEHELAGARRLLEFAGERGVERLLFTSSGAVYGPQPPELAQVPEEYAGAPDSLDPYSAYGQAKRACEWLCAAYGLQHGIAVKIARLFAFIGPHLPLDAGFAAGNFIRDALGGGPIRVAGDGTAQRSYLYAADLAIWLWTILVKGASGRAWNVGSPDAISIAALAHEVAHAAGPTVKVEIQGREVAGMASHRYVPSVERARRELGLEPRVALGDAIRRSLTWHGANLVAAEAAR